MTLGSANSASRSALPGSIAPSSWPLPIRLVQYARSSVSACLMPARLAADSSLSGDLSVIGDWSARTHARTPLLSRRCEQLRRSNRRRPTSSHVPSSGLMNTTLTVFAKHAHLPCGPSCFAPKPLPWPHSSHSRGGFVDTCTAFERAFAGLFVDFVTIVLSLPLGHTDDRWIGGTTKSYALTTRCDGRPWSTHASGRSPRLRVAGDALIDANAQLFVASR